MANKISDSLLKALLKGCTHKSQVQEMAECGIHVAVAATLEGDEEKRIGRALTEMDAKMAARLLLADSRRALVTPTYEEWIGLNMLERDDELPKQKSPRNRA